MRSYRFRPYSRWIAAIVALASALHVDGQQRASARASSFGSLGSMRAGFVHPPESARLRCYWWWLNGNTDKATITHDLEQMKAKGYGGALLVDANGADQGGNDNVPAGPTFGSAAWREFYRHALREADRLGLELTLNITSGWNLGGPDVTPEQASKLLTWSHTEVAGGRHISVKIDLPPIRNNFYRQIAVLAYPLANPQEPVPPNDRLLAYRTAAAETGFSMPPSGWMLTPPDVPTDTPLAAVKNLASQVAEDGTLTWDVPAGSWEILRIGYTNSDARVSTSSGAWQGLAIDYLSRDAFNAYWDHTVAPLLADARPFHSLKTLTTDSWELGGTNWTDTFAAEFQRRRGYDPVPWLPAVTGRVVESSAATTRFLADLRRTVADLIVANHYNLFAERAAEAGLGVQAESGGPHGAPLDALETFQRSAIPQTEFWAPNAHRSKDEERFFAKQAASAVNIYGKHLVAQEGETSLGPHWSESLATDLKPAFDMAITEGMNRLVWHTFTSSPASTGLPGQEYFAGTHLNPKVTWWDAGDAFFQYLNRVQFMMQQGVPVDDVLYFYGDNVPAFVRLKADDPAHVLPGYDYDVTNQDALLHTLHAETGQLLSPSGIRWRLLAMPVDRHVSLAALQQIATYVRSGGVLVGLAPLSTTGLVSAADQTRFAALTQELWGTNCAVGAHRTVGRGEVWCTDQTRTVLTAKSILPDVAVENSTGVKLAATSNAALDYIHRHMASAEIYFFRNSSPHQVDTNVLLRASGQSVELWDAVTDQRSKAPGAEVQPDGRTRLALSLPPFGSIFVVLAHSTDGPLSAPPRLVRSEPLRPLGPWRVTFQPNRGAPATPVPFAHLTNWTESDIPGVRYFSGTAVYRADVIAPEHNGNDQVWIRFADVREIARIRINGHMAGTVWAKPLALDVGPWLRPGRNTLEIEVTNLWPNRIIGDLQPGATAHYTETNIRIYKPDSPLLPSGLIGELEWDIRR